MRSPRLVRLIGYAWLACCALLLAIPLAHGAATPGVPPLPARFIFCDAGAAGDNISQGHANLTAYCGAENDKTSGMNKVCSVHGGSYSPPGADVGPSYAGNLLGAPDNPAQRYIDCQGTGSSNWNARWLRLCPSTTTPNSYAGQTWKSVFSAGSGVACPAAPPPTDQCDAKEGQAATGTGYFGIGTSPDNLPTVATCKDGCMAFFNGDSPAGRRLVNGVYQYYAYGSYKYQGGACTSGDAPPNPGAMPNDSCPSGKVLTTKPDGSKVCVDPATDDEQDPNEDGKCPAWCGCGTKTTNNPDGSVDTTVTTWESGSGGGYSCLKKTYHDPDGDGPMPGGPGSGQPPAQQDEEKPDEDGDGNPDPAPDPMEEFCKKHPDNDMCKKGSFSGACEGGFTCDGDAVECAVAKATNELNCAFKPGTTTLADILEAGGLTGKETELKSSLTATTTDIGSILQLNQRDLTGSCPAAISGSVMGASFEINLSPLCELAEILGALLMISAAMVSARIIAGGA